MNAWVIFWGIMIFFSIVSFTYMSVKVVVKGFAEMKSMFVQLEKDNNKN